MHRTLTLLVFCAAAFAQPPATQKKLAALEGLDPVLLTEGKEVQGAESIALEHGHFLYQFSTPESKAKFQQHPDQYEIQLGGACARMGGGVTGRADSYFVYKNRIYVFGSADCYKHFAQNPTKYLESEQPKQVWAASVQSRERGDVLVKKMIAAMGGAEKWRSVHAVSETRKAKTPQGEVTISVSFLGPASYRSETAFGENRFGNLFSPAGAFRLFRDDAVLLSDDVAETRRGEWMRELVPMLLRLPQSIAISTVENQIDVNDHGVLYALELDPRTARIAAITWFGRGEGFGQFRISLSDYRAVDGLQLPFHVEGTFEGAAGSPDRTFTVQSYEINPEHMDSRFEKPAKIRQQ